MSQTECLTLSQLASLMAELGPQGEVLSARTDAPPAAPRLNYLRVAPEKAEAVRRILGERPGD